LAFAMRLSSKNEQAAVANGLGSFASVCRCCDWGIYLGAIALLEQKKWQIMSGWLLDLCCGQKMRSPKVLPFAKRLEEKASHNYRFYPMPIPDDKSFTYGTGQKEAKIKT
jgi:hypothetical protein